jgi:membrane associated rhomboid family serine protease
MFPPLAPITRALIIANVLVYLLELAIPGPLNEPGPLVELFALWPLGPLFHPWQVVTYAFLHDPHYFTHILFNMFALYMFGSTLENYWRSHGAATFYVLFYFASVLAAAGTELLVLGRASAPGPVLGASGGVFGVLLAFAWFFPRNKLIVLPIPIPISAWLLVTIYGAIELWLGVTGRQEGVAHFAHLGGMLGGAIMILLWRTMDRGRATLH